MKNIKTKLWYIQSNPKNYDLINATKEFDYDFWRVFSKERQRAHAKELNEEDLCLFWESGKDAGFIASGHVIKSAHLRVMPDIFYKFNKEKPDKISEKTEELIQLSYDWVFPKKYTQLYLKKTPGFKEEYQSGLSSQGTYFPATIESWNFFQKLFGKNFIQHNNKINYWLSGLTAPKESDKTDLIFIKMMNEGIYALGWPQFIDDMSDLKLKDINTRLELTDLNRTDKDCHRIIKFDMDIGDIIIAKKGDSPSNPQKRVYAIGVVTSGYKYDRYLDPRSGGDSSHNYHYRDVEWVFNFYHDYNTKVLPDSFLELQDIFDLIKAFPRVTLSQPKDFEFFFHLKEAIKKKLKQLVMTKLVDLNYIRNYEDKFKYLKLRARYLKSLLAKIKEFDNHVELKNQISNLYKKLDEFKEKYPFRKDPNTIDLLTTDDIYIEDTKGKKEVGDFFYRIEYDLEKVGRYFTYTTTYSNIAKQLDDFKDLLKMVVDDARTLKEKVDANWAKIPRMGGDKQIAKKIIFCYYNENLPIFKTAHLENIFINIYGKNKLPIDYKNMTLGERYQFFTESLLSFKDSLDITKEWNNVFFSKFLYQEVGFEKDTFHLSLRNGMISESNLYKKGLNTLIFLKRNMNVW